MDRPGGIEGERFFVPFIVDDVFVRRPYSPDLLTLLFVAAAAQAAGNVGLSQAAATRPTVGAGCEGRAAIGRRCSEQDRSITPDHQRYRSNRDNRAALAKITHWLKPGDSKELTKRGIPGVRYCREPELASPFHDERMRACVLATHLITL